MKSIYYFALKEDLLSILDLVEANGSLQYTRTGNFTGQEVSNGIIIHDKGSDIPNLGIARGHSSTLCECYLVSEGGSPINLRRFPGRGGIERVCVDQLINPETISFLPGGIWGEDVVLEGRIATASDSSISRVLMKRFLKAVRSNFTKVKVFYVGPKAFALLKNGKRLTSSAQSPSEYDLTLG